MVSTKELEDTLPITDPGAERFGDCLGKKYAIYSMASLDKSKLEQLEEDTNTAEDSTGNSRLAHQADFSGRSLRDIYNHHVGARDEDATTHPLYFIVADQDDWRNKGVLMVYLRVGTDGPQDVVGVGRCEVGLADCYGVNLDIGNADWIDFKEEEQRLWGDEDPYENTRYFASNPTAPSPLATAQHYAWYSIVRKAVPISDMLEPGWVYMKRGESRLHMVGNWHPSRDPWTIIRGHHPWHCLQRPELHRQLFLVAEKEDADSPEGMALCRVRWDGNLDSFSYDPNSYEESERDRQSVLDIRPEVEIIKKIKASEALTELDSIASQS